METVLRKLQTNVWRTSGARYNAARRLRRRETVSTASLAFFSALSVAIAFVEKSWGQKAPDLDSYLSLLSATLGIFLLTISLIEWGSRNGAKAELLHQNAEDLNALQRRVEQLTDEHAAGAEVSWEQFGHLREEYEAVKRKCLENHAPVDDFFFLARHRLDKDLADGGKPKFGETRKALYVLWYQLSSVWYFACLWVVVLVALLVAPWCSL